MVDVFKRTIQVIVGGLVHQELAQRAAPVPHIRQHLAGLFRDRVEIVQQVGAALDDFLQGLLFPARYFIIIVQDAPYISAVNVHIAVAKQPFGDQPR